MKNIILDENGNIEDENFSEAADAYTPDPIHEDLPVNQNQISGFEYRHGEASCMVIAAAVVWLVLLLIYTLRPT